MKKVSKIIQELNKFPGDYLCSVYEGEVSGLSIFNDKTYAGFIYTNTNDETEIIDESKSNG